MRKLFIILTSLLFVLTACNGIGGGDAETNNFGEPPANAITISIIYAPESDEYMQRIIPAFNEAQRHEPRYRAILSQWRTSDFRHR